MLFKKHSFKIILCLIAMILTGCANKKISDISFGSLLGSKEQKPLQTQPPTERVVATPPVTVQKRKIALFLPTQSTSPQIRNVALSLLNAANMAKQELNEPQMELLVYQTDGTSHTDIPATQRAIADKVDLILGPLLAPSVMTMRPLTEAAGIPMLAFSSDETTVTGGFSYLLSYLLEQNVSAVVKYAFTQGHKNYGIYASQTPYGERVAKIFTDEVNKNNGKITNSVLYKPNSSDFYLKTKAFAETDIRISETVPLSYTSIMLADDARSMMRVLPLLERYNLPLNKILLLGTGIWHEPNILQIQELEGAVFAAPDHQKLEIFEQRYKKAYGAKPVQIASLAYDGVGLAVALMRQNPQSPFDINNITNPNGFMGVGGVFRFHNNGLSERGLSILQIKNGAFNILIPAPQTWVGS